MYTTYSSFPNEISGLCTICGHKTSLMFDLCKTCYNEYGKVETPDWLRSLFNATQRRRRQINRDNDAGLVSLDAIIEARISDRML